MYAEVSYEKKNAQDQEMIPELEEPELGESGGALLDSDVATTFPVRLAFVEAILKLLVRDVSFQEFVRDALLEIVKMIRSEGASILEVDHDKQAVFFRAAVGCSSDKIVKFVIPIGKGVVGFVAESRQPLRLSQLNESAVHLGEISKAVGFEARNILAVPIVVRERVYGVLELLNRVGEGEYSDTDLETAKYAAQQLARALEVRFMLAWLKVQGSNRERRAA